MGMTGYRNREERFSDKQGVSVIKTAAASADSVELLKSINTNTYVANLLAVTTNAMFSDEDRAAAFAKARKAMFGGR